MSGVSKHFFKGPICTYFCFAPLGKLMDNFLERPVSIRREKQDFSKLLNKIFHNNQNNNKQIIDYNCLEYSSTT